MIYKPKKILKKYPKTKHSWKICLFNLQNIENSSNRVNHSSQKTKLKLNNRYLNNESQLNKKLGIAVFDNENQRLKNIINTPKFKEIRPSEDIKNFNNEDKLNQLKLNDIINTLGINTVSKTIPTRTYSLPSFNNLSDITDKRNYSRSLNNDNINNIINIKTKQLNEEILFRSKEVKSLKDNEISESFQNDDEFISRFERLIISQKDKFILNSAYSTTNDLNREIEKTSSDGNQRNINLKLKDFNHFQSNKNLRFLDRMYVDICKRQSKEKTLLLITNKKDNIAEKNLLSPFNRLISDSNRILEIKQYIDKMNDILQYKCSNYNKKYNEKNWDNIYRERFIKPEKLRKKINQDLQEKKQKLEKEKEDQIVSKRKILKAPKDYIDSVVHRVFSNSLKRTKIKGCHNSINDLNTIVTTFNRKYFSFKSKSKQILKTVDNTLSTDLAMTTRIENITSLYNVDSESKDKKVDDEKYKSTCLSKTNEKNVFNNKRKVFSHNIKFKTIISPKNPCRKSFIEMNKQTEESFISGSIKHLSNNIVEKDKISSNADHILNRVKNFEHEDLIKQKKRFFKINNDLRRFNDKNTVKTIKNKFVTDANASRIIDSILVKKLK